MEGPSGDLIVKKEEPASPPEKEKSGVYLGEEGGISHVFFYF
jgi:hypothetical protein